MGNGMIGLNPVQAKSRIEEFNTQASAIQRDFVAKTSSFFSSLSKAWFSPKAIKFQIEIFNLVDKLDKELVFFIESVVNDSCQAFNAIASSHGCPNIYINSGPFTGSEYIKLLPSDETGNVGMKINEVKVITLEYVNSLNNIINNIQALPRNIAFYDREGILEKGYADRINKICSMVEKETTTIDTKLANLISEEISRVQASTSSATETLSS